MSPLRCSYLNGRTLHFQLRQDREAHVRFWEGAGVRLPRATRLPHRVSRPGRGPREHPRVPRKGLQPKTPALGARLLATRGVRARAAGSNAQEGRCAAAFLMSFLRHGEIYPFDEGAITQDRALAHRKDEFPAGYSLAGCAPAEPASASPAGPHLARKRLRCTMQFQRTARSALAVCLSPGDNPIGLQSSFVAFKPA